MESITEMNQYLTFKLDDEIYAIDIMKIREVLEFEKVAKVPKTPEFMRGVINLRGGVVPVIDLKLKFGMDKTIKTVDTCIIIFEIVLDNELTVLGALTDSVQEVIEILPNSIEPAPKIGTRLKTDFIKGMGKLDEEFVMILDIDKVFSEAELEQVLGNELEETE